MFGTVPARVLLRAVSGHRVSWIPVRFLNGLLGLVGAVSPWIVQGSKSPGQVNGLVAGRLVIALSFPWGRRTESYGSWDARVF